MEQPITCWRNGQAMTPLVDLQTKLANLRAAEADAWAAGLNKRALHLNAHVAGMRRAIAQQESEIAAIRAARKAA